MNAKIQQLMDRAFTDEQGEQFDPERFAELIVRECAEIADTERSNSVGCGYITKTNGMRIKEHFGIVE
jgi:NTP pyrophosphatase (non-canonical NTP hydrolase)